MSHGIPLSERQSVSSVKHKPPDPLSSLPPPPPPPLSLLHGLLRFPKRAGRPGTTRTSAGQDLRGSSPLVSLTGRTRFPGSGTPDTGLWTRRNPGPRTTNPARIPGGRGRLVHPIPRGSEVGRTRLLQDPVPPLATHPTVGGGLGLVLP